MKSAASELVPLLMLVPYFAPQSHAAMFRAHKLARYLPEYGFQPVVVTTDTNYIYNDDPELLKELPSEVEIHRARYVEPSLRGLNMALGGRDRSFAAMKRASAHRPQKVAPIAAAPGSPQRIRIGGTVARFIGDYPDRHWTWALSAYRLASRLIRQHEIRLMYTSASPTSPLRAALKLQEKHGLSWLFDARDPLGYGRKSTAKTAVARVLERAILKRAITSADHVTGLARCYGQIFFDHYGLPEERFSFIPTGLDEAYLQSVRKSRREDFLLFIGEVMPDQGRHAFDVLELLLASANGEAPFTKILFVGRREVNEPRVRRLTADLPRLQQRVEFIDHRPQHEVYELIGRARACLLVPGELRYWWNNFAKMVDYIALGAPVIAHVPPISEARHELERSGTAYFLEGEFNQDTAGLLTWLRTCDGIRRPDYADRYMARRQVADFAALLRHLYANAGHLA